MYLTHKTFCEIQCRLPRAAQCGADSRAFGPCMKRLDRKSIRSRSRIDLCGHKAALAVLSVFGALCVLCPEVALFSNKKATPAWIETRDGAAYSRPTARFDWSVGKLRARARSFSLTASSGFCLCHEKSMSYTAAHKYAPKFAVDCTVECSFRPELRVHHLGNGSTRAVHVYARLDTPSASSSRTDIQRLVRGVLSSAIRPAVHVRMPNGRKRIDNDFVARGIRLAMHDIARLRERIDMYMSTVPKFTNPNTLPRLFNGRGIVIVGSSSNVKYSTGYWIAIHSIRRAGCRLPIEVWFPRGEIPTILQTEELRKLGATVRTLKPTKFHSRFSMKLLSVAMSDFDEILFMDSDNIALRDVSELFDSISFMSTGAILWQDFWVASVAPDFHEILPPSPELAFNGTHESGQFIVQKSRIWRALCLALFFNAHASSIFSPLASNYMGWGDKEFLFIALAATQTPFSRVEHLPHHIGVDVQARRSVYGNAMLQFDEHGGPMFLHANIGKLVADDVPANFTRYNRRWTTQDDGKTVKDVRELLKNATGEADFERWLHGVLVDVRFGVLNDSRRHRRNIRLRAQRRWYLDPTVVLARAPLLEGMFLDDHPGRRVRRVG